MRALACCILVHMFARGGLALGLAGPVKEGPLVAPVQVGFENALSGRYEIKEEVARGGMAVVYRARDLKHGRDVALKVLPPELSLAVSVARFEREIQTAARLEHPYIIKLHDSGEALGVLYYVMPFVGNSLRRRMSAGPMPVTEALRIAREVAEALDYAHTQNVVHRDIKPENVLFESGHAVVADFGIAKAIREAKDSRVTGSGVVLGTTEYMSPEQARGETELDGRTDIYSLGLVLYEMLAGNLPTLDGEGPIKRLERLRPEVSPAVSDLLRRAIAHDPADRFQTAGALADALSKVGGARRFWERRWVRAVSLPAIAVIAVAGWWLVADGARPLDPKRVVVFPLVDRAGRGAGEDVASMIGSALEHTEPLKWIDGWTWLGAAEREEVARLTPAAARGIARDRGARYYIDGSLLARGESVTVILRLNDVAGDSVIGQESASGRGTTSPATVSLGAVNRLLPRLLEPGRRVDFSVLAERAPAAVANWLQGEREYRRSRFQPALEYYRRAVEADSALSFAALKGAQAAGWLNAFGEARRLVAIALRRDNLLPLRHALFARGLDAYWGSRADTAFRWLRQAVIADPDWGEAQMALGEALYHLLPPTSSFADSAEAVFRTAAVADTGFSPPLFHLAEMAIRRKDLAGATLLIQRFEQFGPSIGQWEQLTAMADCVKRGPRIWNGVSASGLELLAAGRALSVAAAQPECAMGAFRAVLAREDSASLRWGALLGLQGMLVATGRSAEAGALLDSAVAAGTPYANTLFFLNALAGAALEERAASAADQVWKAIGTDYTRLQPETQWILGLWHAHTRDTTRLVALYRSLLTAAERSPNRRTILFASALTAHVTLARGDTAGAIALFRATSPSATRDSLEWELGEPLPYERLQLARLLLARREFNEVLEVAAAFDHPTPIAYVSFVPASLELRYRAAQALARPALADQVRGRLARLGREDLLVSPLTPQTGEPR